MTERIIEKNRGSKHWNWRGGRKKDKYSGYIFVYNPIHPNCNNRRYIREHRLIMEKDIGRYLYSWEVVDHINGIKDDNRIENLRLTPSKEHNKQVQKVYLENQKLKLKIKELEQKLRI